MNVNELIAELDELLRKGDDAVTEAWLVETTAKFVETEPENVMGISVLFNELGSFYRARNILDKGEEAFLNAKAVLEETRGYTYILDGPAPEGCCSCSTNQPLNYDAAASCTGEEPKTHTEIVFTNESTTANYATTLNNLAGLYRMQGRFDEAAEMFDAAIAVYSECGNAKKDFFASAYNNKGLVYLDKRDTEAAKACFNKALEIMGDESFDSARGTTYANIGSADILAKDYRAALADFNMALPFFLKEGNAAMAASCEGIIKQLQAAIK